MVKEVAANLYAQLHLRCNKDWISTKTGCIIYNILGKETNMVCCVISNHFIKAHTYCPTQSHCMSRCYSCSRNNTACL